MKKATIIALHLFMYKNKEVINYEGHKLSIGYKIGDINIGRHAIDIQRFISVNKSIQ